MGAGRGRGHLVGRLLSGGLKIEYDRFLRLVADFQSMQQWEPEEGEAILLEDYCLED